MAAMELLQGSVKHYDWGGYDFIPSLLNIANTEKNPFAEYWMGNHPKAENFIINDLNNKKSISLQEFLKTKNVIELPFLFKILDVKDMLSIQVHPSKADAEKGFADENEKSIPLDAPHRNYKDDNHKPEMMVALSNFWLLHGFKPRVAMQEVLMRVPELQFLTIVFDQNGYSGLYKHIMELPQEDVNKHLQPLLDRIIPIYQSGELKKDSEDFWAARAALHFCKDQDIDRGIFSIYIFNLVHLKPGEGIFQDAGLPHAYLEGQNVELMASSDNVLRGGLTPKHIDVPELLKHVRGEATHPDILKPELKNGEFIFNTPSTEFELSRIEIEKSASVNLDLNQASFLIIISGILQIENENNVIELAPGRPSAILLPGKYSLTALYETVVYKASTPGD